MFEQIDSISDGIAVDAMRHRLADFRQRHPEFDISVDMAESLVLPNHGIRFADTIRCDDVFGYGPHINPDFCVANCALKRHLRNGKDSAVGSGEKESGRSLAWVLRWQERRKARKERKLSRREEGRIGKADRIVSYEKQKIHHPEQELVFVEDADRVYRAQLNFMRILSKVSCVPESMKITDEDV